MGIEFIIYLTEVVIVCCIITNWMGLDEELEQTMKDQQHPALSCCIWDKTWVSVNKISMHVNKECHCTLVHMTIN